MCVKVCSLQSRLTERFFNFPKDCFHYRTKIALRLTMTDDSGDDKKGQRKAWVKWCDSQLEISEEDSVIFAGNFKASMNSHKTAEILVKFYVPISDGKTIKKPALKSRTQGKHQNNNDTSKCFIHILRFDETFLKSLSVSLDFNAKLLYLDRRSS